MQSTVDFVGVKFSRVKQINMVQLIRCFADITVQYQPITIHLYQGLCSVISTDIKIVF